MSSNCSIKLHDRVKQISNTEGTGNMALHSSVDGFLNFGNVYSHQDTVFYGISDGVNFEIGSGIFLRADFDGSDAITVDQINRKAFTSSATDSGIVNFPSGAKEVFVTYAATHAVFHGSGINSFSPPDNSGIVFWGCDNILDYDSNFVWDKDNKREKVIQILWKENLLFHLEKILLLLKLIKRKKFLMVQFQI